MVDSTRRWTLPGTAGSPYLVARAGDSPALDGWSRLPPAFVRAALERALVSGASVIHQLHEALGGSRRSGLTRAAHDAQRREMLRRLEEAFRCGELIAYRRPLPVVRHAVPESELEPAPLPEQPIAEAPENYVTIQLVGEDGAGIPGARYRLVLPDETIREGTLDGSGIATVRGRFSGTCKVSFPELDSEAWEAAA